MNRPAVNVGTIGHIDIGIGGGGKSSLCRALLAAAAMAGLLHNAPPAVLPTRRPEFEPGFDLNDCLNDAGNRAQRKARKADRRARLQDLQRAAVTGK